MCFSGGPIEAITHRKPNAKEDIDNLDEYPDELDLSNSSDRPNSTTNAGFASWGMMPTSWIRQDRDDNGRSESQGFSIFTSKVFSYNWWRAR